MNLKTAADVASPNILDAPYRQSLQRALTRILHTQLAEDAYAEILDGMPMAATYRDFSFTWQTHPSQTHTELCPGSREKARDFRASFDIATLQLSLNTLFAFQDADLGSKQFHLRLLELVAASCHQIAVYLYNLTGRNHHHAEHDKWRERPVDPEDPYSVYRPPIAFTHGPYEASEQHPHGLADVAAFWAEAKIFGGIIVFDRGETEKECRELYMHACLQTSPRTPFVLTTKQFDEFIHFLLDEVSDEDQGTASSPNIDKTPPCPLPIKATRENRWHWDPWDAFARFHVFRERYERKVPDVKPKDPRHGLRASEWPDVGDEMTLIHWDYERRQGVQVDQTLIERLEKSIRMVTPSSPLWHKECERRRDEARGQLETVE